jgi:hypothetical protein
MAPALEPGARLLPVATPAHRPAAAIALVRGSTIRAPGGGRISSRPAGTTGRIGLRPHSRR